MICRHGDEPEPDPGWWESPWLLVLVLAFVVPAAIRAFDHVSLWRY